MKLWVALYNLSMDSTETHHYSAPAAISKEVYSWGCGNYTEHHVDCSRGGRGKHFPPHCNLLSRVAISPHRTYNPGIKFSQGQKGLLWGWGKWPICVLSLHYASAGFNPFKIYAMEFVLSHYQPVHYL